MTTPREYPVVPRESTLSQLPPESSLNAQDQISELLSTASLSRLVVLDDDPTGTQTCHDIAVLTVWDIPTLQAELQQPSPGFFILTNSRALPPLEAEKLIRTICENVQQAANLAGTTVDIVLRGDSTLRGHFPLEADVAQSVFGPADAIILAPFFFQGGRLTINDIHYVAEGDNLVPAGATQFARDATFGFKSSNLHDYVLEKAPGRFTPEQIHSITIEDIRVNGPSTICEKLLALPKGSVVIVNAAAESDMHVFVAGLLKAKSQSQKHYLYRTAAAFVSTSLGIRPQAPLTAASFPEPQIQTGTLIIAGSYVPKTTAQLNHLITKHGPTGTNTLSIVELDVEDIIATTTSSSSSLDPIIDQTVSSVESSLLSGKDALVMTSRKLITGGDELSSLAIGGRVAEALVEVLKRVKVRPRVVIAKGGITSSDAATKGLGIKRAMILGQAAPGVPLWRCDEETARHRGVPFVVFPGNVGGVETLGEIVEGWR
ncbi:hypothetical protein CBS63078_10187 [Aspergillus niger]|uniref:Ketose-bisphosphate aldolase class-II family protein n=2 Tax=Aspergillus TaxID=5052 RepID=A0A370PLZ4_ASPPH|nr:hypothetical protein CBS115989_4692 [Aspergillus niger]RDH18740.1 hypothetical protein M747DRAFT_332741 [Aspergillus niger ATCC 13496]RDK43208.1 hypothetical protein M752DRAFT_249843 [Aspergillus phoenicis ATCC 13157]KAI2838569.1 hypothetical protein CBS11350_8041 [Aspergillus niger]KAI2839864.1 hypothetical protein CBS11232_9257 [Aspergillus niger]